MKIMRPANAEATTPVAASYTFGTTSVVGHMVMSVWQMLLLKYAFPKVYLK